MATATTTGTVLVNGEEAAKILGIQPQTLFAWRHRRRTPAVPFVRMGMKVLYRPADLARYIEENLNAPPPPKGQTAHAGNNDGNGHVAVAPRPKRPTRRKAAKRPKRGGKR